MVELVAGDVVVDLAAPSDGVLVRKYAAQDEQVVVGSRLAVFGADDRSNELSERR